MLMLMLLARLCLIIELLLMLFCRFSCRCYATMPPLSLITLSHVMIRYALLAFAILRRHHIHHITLPTLMPPATLYAILPGVLVLFFAAMLAFRHV